MNRAFLDLTNKQFGDYTVIGRGPDRKKHIYWTCRCKCGVTKLVEGSGLTSGRAQRCSKCNATIYLFEGVGELSKTYWSRLIAGAKKRRIPFDVKMEDLWELYINQARKCAITGVPIKFGRFSSKKTCAESDQTASLDRIDPTQGYVLTNVRWVHKHINRMRWILNDAQFYNWAKLIVEGPLANQKISVI